MNQLSMDLVRVTEAAAITASAWIGTGEEEQADRAATEVMRDRLNRVSFAARVIIGEERKNHRYGQFYGETVSRRRDCVLHGDEPTYELCVDPIEGTRPTVTSGPEAISASGATDGVFAATGIASGSLLSGVRFTERGAVTHSVFMRSKPGTIRWMTTEHGN
jgi:fructose-1,6-bisphosphatase/sedoheptulose 1,7-bisphosphatase-like protein